MKKYFLIFATVLFAGLWSCEEEPVTPNGDEPTEPATATVGLKAAASTELTYDFVTAENNVWTVEVEATLGDGFDSDIEVSLEAAADATLADTYYTIAPATATIAEGAATFTVTVNSAPADGSYTLPLTLVCETENVTVNPEANSVALALTVAEPKASLALTAPGTYAKVDAGYSFTYTVATESEYIPEGAEYKIGVTVTDKNGTELNIGTDYTIDGKATSFAEGKSNTYVVTVNTADLAIDNVYTIAVELKGGNGFAVADGAAASTLRFEPYPLWNKTGITAADLIWNSAGTNPNDHPLRLFDGNESTGWYCAYGKPRNTQDNALACDGINSVNGVPCFVGVHFKEALTIHAIRVTPMTGDNAKRSRSFGFRFDWDMKEYGEEYTTIGSNGEGDYKSSMWDYTKDWEKFLTEFFTFDRVILGIGGTDKSGGDGANDDAAKAYYSEARWCVLSKDVTTEYLQYWALSSKWEWPAINTDENSDGRGNDGSASGAREIDIRLGTPVMTVVE